MDQPDEDLPRREGLILAAVGGCTDAITYRHYHAFPANMTGNTVLLGISASSGHLLEAATSVGLIFCFIAGSAAGRALTLKFRLRGALLGEMILLGLATVSFGFAPAPFLAATAMGLQNASVSNFKGIKVNTSFISGNYGRLGRTATELLLNRGDGAYLRHELITLAAFLTAYIFGALGGAAASAVYGRALFIPAVAIAFVALVFRRK